MSYKVSEVILDSQEICGKWLAEGYIMKKPKLHNESRESTRKVT